MLHFSFQKYIDMKKCKQVYTTLLFAVLLGFATTVSAQKNNDPNPGSPGATGTDEGNVVTPAPPSSNTGTMTKNTNDKTAQKYLQSEINSSSSASQKTSADKSSAAGSKMMTTTTTTTSNASTDPTDTMTNKTSGTTSVVKDTTSTTTTMAAAPVNNDACCKWSWLGLLGLLGLFGLVRKKRTNQV
jgi:hypothetical protein